MKSFFKETGHWLLLLVATDLTFILLVWLLKPEAIGKISVFIVLFTLIIIYAGYAVQSMILRRRIWAVQVFLDHPDEATKNTLISTLDHSWQNAINALYVQFQDQKTEINQKTLALQNYQEYIEAWTHEIKTPLSLIMLVLNNHREEMSPYVYARMEHAKQRINEDVERILFFARLQADHVDFIFSRFRLDECVGDVLSDFASVMEETKIVLLTQLHPEEIVSDRKVLSFMIAQFISNAVKYASLDNGRITVEIKRDVDHIYLSVRDNGSGVPAEDMPFIFDKGFTGNHLNRQKATGMGLYLVSKYAASLAISVHAESSPPPDTGFCIELGFPMVNSISEKAVEIQKTPWSD